MIDSQDKAKYDKFYSSSKAEKIINKSDIDNVSQPIYTRIITKRQKYLGRGSDWIIDYFIVHTISISRYNPLASSSYIKLPKELVHQRKDLINIQNNNENECFKLLLVRYINLAEHKPRRIAKVNKDFAKRLDLKT